MLTLFAVTAPYTDPTFNRGDKPLVQDFLRCVYFFLVDSPCSIVIPALSSNLYVISSLT